MARISARTAATTPLTGAEIVGLIQGGLDRRTTSAMLVGDFVTPEKYGAIGDGVTDDTTAFQAALDTGARGVFAKNIYKITATLQLAQDQILFGLPKSMVNDPTPASTTPRIINSIVGTNKVLIRNAAGTDGNGVRDLHLAMGTHAGHCAIMFTASYGNIAERIHFSGEFKLGVLSDDTYVCRYKDLIFTGCLVHTANVFIGASNAMLVEGVHTGGTTVGDAAECLYGVAITQGHANVIRNCILQGSTIGIATGSTNCTLQDNYFEASICNMRLGDVGSSQGKIRVIGGFFTEPYAAHPQYASRGPQIIVSCNTVTLDTPVFEVDATTNNLANTGPFPILIDTCFRLTLINPYQYLGLVATYAKDMLIRRVATTNAGITIIGSGYDDGNGYMPTEIVLKDTGEWASKCYSLRVDLNGKIGTISGAAGAWPGSATADVITTGPVWQPALMFGSPGNDIAALLQTALPSGASLVALY